MIRLPRWSSPLILTLPLLLGGCQATMERIADCKAGDWNTIGHKDGAAGDVQNYAERKDFCDSHDGGKGQGDAAAGYLAGWAQGNWDFWSARGVNDGRQALPQSTYERHVASEDVQKQHTPLNRPAYDAGWMIGNADYWNGQGKRDGTDGKPASAKEAAATARRSKACASTTPAMPAAGKRATAPSGRTPALPMRATACRTRS